jgi:hypothetical protein
MRSRSINCMYHAGRIAQLSKGGVCCRCCFSGFSPCRGQQGDLCLARGSALRA